MSRDNGKARRSGLFAIASSGIQGRGAFATRRIRPGRFITEYAGERISNDEADRRYDDRKMNRHHTYLFVLNDDVVVDGNRKGNEARYINHSCDPNCEAVIEDGRIKIYAKKNIQPGVELTYDYQYAPTGEPGEEDLYACECGAEKCRGTIVKRKRLRRKKRD